MVITKYPSPTAAFLSNSWCIGVQKQGVMECIAPRDHAGMGVRLSTVKQVQVAGDRTRVGCVRHNFTAPGYDGIRSLT